MTEPTRLPGTQSATGRSDICDAYVLADRSALLLLQR